MCSFDTEAGLIIVWKTFFSREWSTIASNEVVPKLSSAIKEPRHDYGTKLHVVSIVDVLVKVWFDIVENMDANMLLSTPFPEC